jgi:hypothetical protein
MPAGESLPGCGPICTLQVRVEAGEHQLKLDDRTPQPAACLPRPAWPASRWDKPVCVAAPMRAVGGALLVRSAAVVLAAVCAAMRLSRSGDPDVLSADRTYRDPLA